MVVLFIVGGVFCFFLFLGGRGFVLFFGLAFLVLYFSSLVFPNSSKSYLLSQTA